MIRRIAPALDRYDVNTTRGEQLIREQHVLARSVSPERDNRLVLDHEPSIWIVAARNASVNLAL
jgi:hypothetical protein